MRRFLLPLSIAFVACSAEDDGAPPFPRAPVSEADPTETPENGALTPIEIAPPAEEAPEIADAGVSTRRDSGPDGSPPPVKPAPAIPALSITVAPGLHFTATTIRKPLEDGLRYAVERIAKNVDIGTKKSPNLAIHFATSTDSFASGRADLTSATVWVPYGYPLQGASQNYVVNISVHELGHLLAHHLIAQAGARDLCENEGLASWIAGKYWMNANLAPVSSLRAAAQVAIDVSPAYASMTDCVSASDNWYKVYASFFEYLELKVPGGILAVSSGKSTSSAHSVAWKTWLGR